MYVYVLCVCLCVCVCLSLCLCLCLCLCGLCVRDSLACSRAAHCSGDPFCKPRSTLPPLIVFAYQCHLDISHEIICDKHTARTKHEVCAAQLVLDPSSISSLVPSLNRSMVPSLVRSLICRFSEVLSPSKFGRPA